MFRFGRIILIMLMPALIAACRKQPEPPEPPEPDPTRTIIAYMIADNNLYSNAISDINEMEEAMTGAFNGNLIVYIDPPNAVPYLMQIKHDDTRLITSPKVKIYEEQNSSDAKVMESVIKDVMQMYPADSYGLILWSHGTGWLPSASYSLMPRTGSYGLSSEQYAHPLVKSFGEDAGYEMEITDMAEHLPVKFDFIAFDACFMGCVEVLYQLRHSADYIMASPAEVLVSGFPYNKMIPYLFEREANLSGAAQSYMNYYFSLSGDAKSGTISVIKTDELDRLKESARNLIQNNKTKLGVLDRNTIQKYDYLTTTVFFDLDDFIETLCEGDDMTEFTGSLTGAVIYKGYTPAFLNRYTITRSSGLSCYISSGNAALDSAYASYDWASVW